MPGLLVSVDTAALGRLQVQMAATGKAMPAAAARALNRARDSAKTQMTRELTTQTGLKRRVIVDALKSSRTASAGSLFAEIGSRGGDVRLKYFGARETRSGVSAAPWGKRRVYADTFMKGGRFPNRKGGPFGGTGHAYRRKGKGKWPIKVARSGLFIPAEMIKDRSAAAFYRAVNDVLPKRLEHELARAIGGGR